MTDNTSKEEFNYIMDYLLAHAYIGQAAKWGMYISGFLILLSFLVTLPFSPLSGFILVPMACVWMGIKQLKRGKNT